MSRAFVKEDGPDHPLPDLPVSPIRTTSRRAGCGAARPPCRDAGRAARLRARPDRLDRLPEAAAERDIRYLEARLRSAIPVDPATSRCDEVAFGARVTVVDDDGTTIATRSPARMRPTPLGRIAPHSPLARALMGARVGDTVTWTRPRPDGPRNRRDRLSRHDPDPPPVARDGFRRGPRP